MTNKLSNKGLKLLLGIRKTSEYLYVVQKYANTPSWPILGMARFLAHTKDTFEFHDYISSTKTISCSVAQKDLNENGIAKKVTLVQTIDALVKRERKLTPQDSNAPIASRTSAASSAAARQTVYRPNRP